MSQKIVSMRLGGQKLAEVKQRLIEFTKPGVNFAQIEAEAQTWIKKLGCTPSFSTVPGYDFATCITKNHEMCHGIPAQYKVVEDGDIMTIDVGLIQDGYHLDTTISFGVGKLTASQQQFLAVGQKALDKAIDEARVGKSVYDLSLAMQKQVEASGYTCTYQLTGHGVGEELHMDPMIPCIAQKADKKKKLYAGQTIAIEVMYAAGVAYLVLDADGWTYQTQDGSLSGMFEETVLVTSGDPEVLTR